jgi:hypothetical protein
MSIVRQTESGILEGPTAQGSYGFSAAGPLSRVALQSLTVTPAKLSGAAGVERCQDAAANRGLVPRRKLGKEGDRHSECFVDVHHVSLLAESVDGTRSTLQSGRLEAALCLRSCSSAFAWLTLTRT